AGQAGRFERVAQARDTVDHAAEEVCWPPGGFGMGGPASPLVVVDGVSRADLGDRLGIGVVDCLFIALVVPAFSAAVLDLLHLAGRVTGIDGVTGGVAEAVERLR